MLTGPIVAAKNGAPKQLIVFLHGYGADGNDLINLAPHFSAALPDAMFMSPHAPQTTDMGMGRQWFSLGGWMPGLPWPTHIWDEILASGKALNTWLDAQLEKYHLKPAQLALIGFSQGTMMALQAGLRRPEPMGGIVGFSGRLMAPEKLAAEITARPPVLLVHGQMDPIVQFAEMAKAETVLKANNVPVETLARPYLAHNIDEEGIMAAIQFLQRQFNQ